MDRAGWEQHSAWTNRAGRFDALVDVLAAYELAESMPLAPERTDAAGLPLLLDVGQAAEQLGCSVRKVHGLIADQRLCSVKLDGRRLVRRSDLEAFVLSLPSTPAAPPRRTRSTTPTDPPGSASGTRDHARGDP